MSKYEYKKMYLAIYLCLIAVGAFSMMARWINNINPELKNTSRFPSFAYNEFCPMHDGFAYFRFCLYLFRRKT
jgi:hypothetical protein